MTIKPEALYLQLRCRLTMGGFGDGENCIGHACTAWQFLSECGSDPNQGPTEGFCTLLPSYRGEPK